LFFRPFPAVSAYLPLVTIVIKAVVDKRVTFNAWMTAVCFTQVCRSSVYLLCIAMLCLC